MNANADMNLFALVFLVIVTTELSLNVLGTLDGVDDRRKVHQEPIAHGLDDLAVMVSDRLVDDLIMDGEHFEHTGFIGPHQAAKADDVRKHNRGEATGLGWPRTD